MADSPTAQAAITAALSYNWKEAIRINALLIKEDKGNIATLNRLGYAYAQNGQKTLAKTTFANILKLDPYNQIALKHVKNLESIKKKTLQTPVVHHVSPLSFLEEPGVTKIIACVNLAPAQTLNTLNPGMEVTLKPRNHCVEVRIAPNTYVAALPDDISFKLLRLIASGNRYQALVKGVAKKSLILMIREISRGKKFANQPSFTSPSISISSGSHSGVNRDNEKPDAIATGEGEGEEEEEKEDQSDVVNPLA